MTKLILTSLINKNCIVSIQSMIKKWNIFLCILTAWIQLNKIYYTFKVVRPILQNQNCKTVKFEIEFIQNNGI